jgi:hypothetical protein
MTKSVLKHLQNFEPAREVRKLPEVVPRLQLLEQHLTARILFGQVTLSMPRYAFCRVFPILGEVGCYPRKSQASCKLG